MAKNQKNAPAQMEDNEPVDLLAQSFDERGGKGEDSAGSLYTVEAGGEKVELDIDQLLELAKLCLERGAGSNSETAPDGALSDIPELLEFVKRYPDIYEFPPEVQEQIASGAKPLDAYRDYENSQLKEKLRALEQNDANKKKSPGSAKGDAYSDNELDDLMAIYNAVFK